MSLYRVSHAKKFRDPVVRYASAEKKRLHQAQRARVYLLGKNLLAIGKMNVTKEQLRSVRQQLQPHLDAGVIVIQDLGVPGTPLITLDDLFGPLPVDKEYMADESPNTSPEVLPPPVEVDVPAAKEAPAEKDTLFLVDSLSASEDLEVATEEIEDPPPSDPHIDPVPADVPDPVVEEKEDLHTLLLAADLGRNDLWAIADHFDPSLSKKSKTRAAMDVVLEALDAGATHDYEAILGVIRGK